MLVSSVDKVTLSKKRGLCIKIVSKMNLNKISSKSRARVKGIYFWKNPIDFLLFNSR